MQDFPIIGLLGPAGSGKDLVADWLVENRGFVKVAFADVMKRFVGDLFSLHDNTLWGPSEERNREFTPDWDSVMEPGRLLEAAELEVLPALNLSGGRPAANTGAAAMHQWLVGLRAVYPDRISARIILQTMGTEWGRKQDPLLWVRYAHWVARVVASGAAYDSARGVGGDFMPAAGVVIPDHRFLNEVQATRAAGGQVIRLRRTAKETEEGNVGVAGHASEIEMRSIPDTAFSSVLYLPEGVEMVQQVLSLAFSPPSAETKLVCPDCRQPVGLVCNVEEPGLVRLEYHDLDPALRWKRCPGSMTIVIGVYRDKEASVEAMKNHVEKAMGTCRSCGFYGSRRGELVQAHYPRVATSEVAVLSGQTVTRPADYNRKLCPGGASL